MIDTIKFAIPYDEDVVTSIKKVGTNIVMSYNSASREIKFKIGRGDQPLGSYDRNVNLIIKEQAKQLSLEFSLPKFAFGHNVFMVYPQEVELLLYRLWSNLNLTYQCEFPTPEEWSLLRLDLCYNWRFPTQQQAEVILNHLKNIDYPRKSHGKQVYNTGVFHKAGKLHVIKFYLKQPEFYAHDYKILKNNPKTIEMAYQFHTWSAGVLRFEVSLKRLYLEKEFPHYKGKYHIATRYDKISKLLGEFLTSNLKMISKDFISLTEAQNKLSKMYKPDKASTLLIFWLNTNTYDSKTVQDIIYRGVNRSTIWRRYDDIKKAGLGILASDENIQPYSLDIPSDICTNLPLLATGEGAEAPASYDPENDTVH